MTDNKRIAEVRLGTSGLTVGAQGAAGAWLSEFSGDTDEGATRETLETALACDVTMFDTADIRPRRERAVPSPFVRTYRQQVVIATKFGNGRDADGSMSISNDPGYLRQSIDGSLFRLSAEVTE